MIRLMFRLLCLVFVSATALLGQGQFEYVSHRQGNLLTMELESFDLNRDGDNDLVISFHSTTSGLRPIVAFWFEGQLDNGTRVVTDSYYFADAVVFNRGDLIDGSIPVRTDMERPSADAGPLNWLGDVRVTGFSFGRRSDGGGIGILERDESIFAIQILEADGYHNGWLRFEKVSVGENGQFYRIADWAYNSNPNESILAGMLQVPEPRTWTMFAVGALLFGGVAWIRPR